MLMHMVHDTALAAIDLNLLVLLRAVLRERHVTRAAASVGLSQSAASHALSRLRDLLGDPLLVRRGRTLSLTPRAARLLPVLERGLGELENAIAGEPEFEPTTARRRFTIGAADYLQALITAPLLQRLATHAPFVDLTIVVFPNIGELLESGAIDLALTVANQIDRTLKRVTLFEEGFVCMVRRGHPEVRKRLTLERYLSLRHLVVAPTGTPGSLVDTALEAQGLERRIALRVTNFLIAPVVISETDFISTMPERLARRLAKTYSLELFSPPLELPEFEYCMAWHPRLDEDPAQRWLREFVAGVTKGW